MNRYKVTGHGAGRMTFYVQAEDDKHAIREAELDFEIENTDLIEISGWHVELLPEPEGVIPVVEMAALVPDIRTDFRKVRAFLNLPGNEQTLGEESILTQMTRVLDYAERSMPIRLEEDAREGMEIDMPGYIHYWGTFTDDDTTIETCDGQTVKLPPNWIDKGLAVLAGRHYPRLHELLAGDYDCESLDHLAQAAIFDDIPYG